MFNKTSKPVRQPEPPKAKAPPPLDLATVHMKQPGSTPVAATAPSPTTARTAPSLLAAHLNIEGHITGTADLQIDGNVRGNVKVAHLIVGEAGNIEGDIEAETIEVRGRVLGAINGRSVKLLASAYVEGDITHEALSIDVGAFFQGRCLQNRRTETPPLVQPAVNTSHSFTSHDGAMNSYDLNALSDLK